MIDRAAVLKKAVWFAGCALAVRVAVWAALAAATTLTPGLSIAVGALVLGGGLAFVLLRRSRAAHDRSIRDDYPSFAPALARRRAEGVGGI